MYMAFVVMDAVYLREDHDICCRGRAVTAVVCSA